MILSQVRRVYILHRSSDNNANIVAIKSGNHSNYVGSVGTHYKNTCYQDLLLTEGTAASLCTRAILYLNYLFYTFSKITFST